MRVFTDEFNRVTEEAPEVAVHESEIPEAEPSPPIGETIEIHDSSGKSSRQGGSRPTIMFTNGF